MSATTKTEYSPEDLLAMPDGEDYELVDGRLVERNMGTESSYVAGEIFGIVWSHSRTKAAGWTFPEGTGYQCFPDAPGKVRRPDVSFIALERLAGKPLPKGHLRIAPDLAVEVVSPRDLAYQVDEKVEAYLAAGVRLVWVVNRETRTVRVHRAEGPGLTLRAEDELTGEDVLPGFRCQIADFFRSPSETAPEPAE